MLSLHNIKKSYITGETTVKALDGVSIDFRPHEFVSILGPSGCGKTTLLNVIGGLDRYDEGDLIIGSRSTKEFLDKDWDTYRNHSIGFVFQSYNLIMHQTVLSNVELALTLSGVNREERKKRATAALESVGLGDQLNKKPNQMSGGQMQRVAIARALVNDPDIILADEPTGALDTATSVQIMEILKNISKDKLIIMVTHNPKLAEQYSSRIIRVLDGKVIDDSNPYKREEGEPLPASLLQKEEEAEEKTEEQTGEKTGKKHPKKGKRSMSFFTAMSLSVNNLLTKKTRTLLVSIAGSIGIIGIALILAFSNGVNLYIASVQEETLTSYPIQITSETADYSAMLAAMVRVENSSGENREPGKIYVDDSINNMVEAMTNRNRNNLSAFDVYLREHYNDFKKDLTAVQYTYGTKLQIYNPSSKYSEKGPLQVSPSKVFENFPAMEGMGMMWGGMSIFSEMMPGRDGELINRAVYDQYNLVDGKWPENANEMVLVVDKNNTVTNLTLYMLGICDPDEMKAMMLSVMSGEPYEAKTENLSFTYQDFYDLDLRFAYNSDFFYKTNKTGYQLNGKSYPLWADHRDEEGFNAETLFSDDTALKIVGVISPREGVAATSIQGSVGFTSALTQKVLAHVNESEIVKQQIATPGFDLFTGLPFAIEDADRLTDEEKKEKLSAYFETLSNPEKAKTHLAIRTAVTDEEMARYLASVNRVIDTKEKRRQFLIDLYGFNSKHGSLKKGSSANFAVAAILDAIEPNPVIPPSLADICPTPMDYYMWLVENQYAEAMGLDGIALVPGVAAYETYAGLIDTMYKTEEKLAAAFTNMTTLAIRTIYPMVEEVNMQKELLSPTADHYQRYLEEMRGKNPAPMQKTMFLMMKFAAANGITDQHDPLAEAYLSYLATADIEKEFENAVYREYTGLVSNNPLFRADASASLFEEYLSGLNTAEYAALYKDHMQKSEGTYEENLTRTGASAGHDALLTISIYPIDFAAKERVRAFIDEYNGTVAEDDQITYTDIMAVVMSSVSTIINAISYVLIAFVSISLVVSSIMIGIITYISVLERIKEIGILRAIGASKRDISRVFNAETLIIGFGAGLIGILTTLLLTIPANFIIKSLSGISNINAVLPFWGAVILVFISMGLTLIAGLIPSRIASKKDPVVALRTE